MLENAQANDLRAHEREPLKLNLGAGDFPLEGYINLDGARGDVIYPLGYVGCVDEIRASHVLEHFGHGEALEVLKNWTGALKPGGVLKIAVPDLRRIARHYLDGDDVDAQRYIMGAQMDERDYHRSLYDEEMLGEAMRACGLRGVRRWYSDVKDCAALPISLNLAATKAPAVAPRVVAVMSVPRLGFMNNARGLLVLPSMNIDVLKATGAYWASCLTRAIETGLETNPEWILTLDYDTLFSRNQVDALLALAAARPDVDAIAALECNRSTGRPLFWMLADDGKQAHEVSREVLQAELLPVRAAHFGLTLLRASRLRELPRPWFYGRPGADGRYGDDRLDDDIAFWQGWARAGFNVNIAARVPIGHLVERAMWPDINLEPIYQDPSEFWASGAPDEVWQ